MGSKSFVESFKTMDFNFNKINALKTEMVGIKVWILTSEGDENVMDSATLRTFMAGLNMVIWMKLLPHLTVILFAFHNGPRTAY